MAASAAGMVAPNARQQMRSRAQDVRPPSELVLLGPRATPRQVLAGISAAFQELYPMFAQFQVSAPSPPLCSCWQWCIQSSDPGVHVALQHVQKHNTLQATGTKEGVSCTQCSSCNAHDLCIFVQALQVEGLAPQDNRGRLPTGIQKRSVVARGSGVDLTAQWHHAGMVLLQQKTHLQAHIV